MLEVKTPLCIYPPSSSKRKGCEYTLLQVEPGPLKTDSHPPTLSNQLRPSGHPLSFDQFSQGPQI